MGSLSDFAELKILDHIHENTAYSPFPNGNIYIGLSVTDPKDDATGILEPTGGAGQQYVGYARRAITFGAPSNRVIAQSLDITFPPAGSGSTGVTVQYWFICDHVSNTTWGTNVNMLAHGQLAAGKNIVVGNTPSIASGQTTITVSAGGCSTYCAHKILDFMFRNQAFTQPTIYVGLATVDITDATTGSTVSESGSGNYARVRHSGWGAASAGSISNDATITMPTPNGSWGTVTAAFQADALTNGQILFYDNNTQPQLVGAGDTVRFNASAFVVNLN